jgi:hypothetical protein
MSYRVGVGSIFKKTNIYGVIKYYQITSGEIVLETSNLHTYVSKENNVGVCLLKIANSYTTLQPCTDSSKSHFEYKHYKFIKDENYNDFKYKGYLKLKDFFIDNWNEIINGDDLLHEFYESLKYNKPLILDNNLFLNAIISEKVSHTYYDTIEKKNKTIKNK